VSGVATLDSGVDGCPMAFDRYELTSAVDPEQWAEATEALGDTWTIVDTATAGTREGELPIDLVVVEFSANEP
jgi:hypothetical protein